MPERDTNRLDRDRDAYRSHVRQNTSAFDFSYVLRSERSYAA